MNRRKRVPTYGQWPQSPLPRSTYDTVVVSDQHARAFPNYDFLAIPPPKRLCVSYYSRPCRSHLNHDHDSRHTYGSRFKRNRHSQRYSVPSRSRTYTTVARHRRNKKIITTRLLVLHRHQTNPRTQPRLLRLPLGSTTKLQYW